VPFDAIEVDNQRHRHGMLRHRMMDVVRKYNQVWAVRLLGISNAVRRGGVRGEVTKRPSAHDRFRVTKLVELGAMIRIPNAQPAN
jgi:hypothetical protein